MRSLSGRRSIGGQRSFTAIIILLLSERGRCSYRTLMTDCIFRAHFNLWWARHGWPLIQPVSRLDSQFSRPPYFTAGVNLTAEPAIEPPRGGEHGAGENCLNRKRSFAESRNCSDYRLREQHTWVKENAADSKSESAAKESQSNFLYIILLKRLN